MTDGHRMPQLFTLLLAHARGGNEAMSPLIDNQNLHVLQVLIHPLLA